MTVPPASGGLPPAGERPGGFDASLDALEAHRATDVQSRLVMAGALEVEATACGATASAMRARLVVADMEHRLGHGADAARMAVEVNNWAASHGPRALLARSHLVLSSILETVGDRSGALDHAIRALDLTDDTTVTRARGNYVLRLADTLALNESVVEARLRYREAEDLFEAIDDRERRLNVLNNLTVLEYESGDVGAALATAERLYAMSDVSELNSACADSIARARLYAGDLTGAEDVARLGLDLWRTNGDVQAVTPVELGLTLAEVLIARGRLDEAHSQVTTCVDLCRERGLRGMLVETLRVQSELLAAQGGYEEAYRVHRQFHDGWVAMRSSQQEAATRTRQALYEAEEARRDAARFRLQAHTDALTGLANRRQVNAELPGLLRRAELAGRCLTAAIVDLDHFKTVNDRYSHQVGDEVLRRVAVLLASSVPGDGELAARLGGEEFLLVMVDTSPGFAAHRVDAVRREVAEHPWHQLAEGLRVTLSAGVAVLRDEDDQSSLLARADLLLYDAKDGGRNLVVADLRDAPPDSPPDLPQERADRADRRP